MGEKENFYHELDTKSRTSFCSCQSLIILFIALVISLVIIISFGINKLKEVVAPERSVISSSQDQRELQANVKQLSTISGQQARLIITERQLTSVLVDKITAEANFPVRSVQAQINPSGIVISGSATQYLKTNFEITFLPQVETGRIRIEITKVRAGQLTIPDQLNGLIGRSMSNLLDQQLNQLASFEIKSLTLDTGQLIIAGLIQPAKP